jgi:nitrate reductase gamma subunit
MVLGLLRILILDIIGMVEAYRRAGDKKIPWRLTIYRTLEWLFPVKRVFNHRPIYSVAAILFHIGLLVTPIFLYAHVRLWEKGIGFGWITLSANTAYWLTTMTIALGFGLLLGRLLLSRARAISRKQDYLWPALLIIPFITGYVCANMAVNPNIYNAFMLAHIISGEIIFVLMPFTKIAHCVLMPLSQLVSVLAWKFPPSVDREIAVTLDKKGTPI